MRPITRAAGVALAVAAIAVVPAAAEVNNQDPGKFVHSLATTGFAALQGEKASARGRFRSLLAQHFAVDAIGDRLIRRSRPKIREDRTSVVQGKSVQVRVRLGGLRNIKKKKHKKI